MPWATSCLSQSFMDECDPIISIWLGVLLPGKMGLAERGLGLDAPVSGSSTLLAPPPYDDHARHQRRCPRHCRISQPARTAENKTKSKSDNNVCPLLTHVPISHPTPAPPSQSPQLPGGPILRTRPTTSSKNQGQAQKQPVPRRVQSMPMS